MSAVLVRLHAVRRAVTGFLAGFLGVGAAPHARLGGGCAHSRQNPSPTPSTVRAALAARSARRGNCC